MPRHSEAVRYTDTYSYLIESERRELRPRERITTYHRAFPGATSAMLLSTYRSDATYFGPFGGDVGILQCGIVDCAPRPLPPMVRSAISRLPTGPRNVIVSAVHRSRAKILRSGVVWRVTAPEQFLSSMTALVTEMCAGFSRVYVLNIAPTTGAMEAHSPGLSASIEKYNGLLADAAATAPNAKLIDVHSLISKGTMEDFVSRVDGHHITVRGHRLFADAILDHEMKAWSGA